MIATRKTWNFALLAAQAWALIVVLILVYCDLEMPKLVEQSDFLACQYPGMKLLALGRLGEMYAPASAVSFIGTQCDIAAHQFLPNLPPNLESAYVYCPLVAWLLAPLSYLSPNLALLAFQSISLVALIAGIHFLVDDPSDERLWQSTSLLILPTAITLWIGQFGTIFGIFCFSAGYRLLMRNKVVAAAAIFAVSCLKPQFVIVPAVLCVVFASRRQWKFPLAFCATGGILILLNLMVGGIQLFQEWIGMLHVTEMVFTNGSAGLPPYLLISVPGTILLSLPVEIARQLKPLIYGLTLAFVAVTLYSCIRFARQCQDSQTIVRYSLISGILLIPFVIPHFLYYDLTLFTVVLVLSKTIFGKQSKLFTYCLVLILMIDVYAVLFLTVQAAAQPFLLLLVMGAVAWRLFTTQPADLVREG